MENKLIDFLLNHKNNKSKFHFGDDVSVVNNPETSAIGISTLVGKVYGFSTASGGQVAAEEIIGESENDLIINVYFETLDSSCWLAESLIVFQGIDPGQTVNIAGRKFIRSQDGTWIEQTYTAKNDPSDNH